MKKFTISFKGAKHEVLADTLPNFKAAVNELVNIPPENLKIIKPSVKSDAHFLTMAAGTDFTIMGTQVNRIIKTINVKENGIQFIKEGEESIGFITYVTSSIQMIKSAVELRNYCVEQNDEENPDLLWAIDLGNIFREIEDVKVGKPVSPVDIITSWVAYTEQYGDYPYKTYDACEFLEKGLEMLQEGAVDDFDERPDDPNIIHDIMRLSYNALQDDKDCQIKDVIDMEKAVRMRHSFFLECEVAPGDTINLYQGIKKYFDGERRKKREVYGVDVEYVEKMQGFTKLPLYIMVRINRFKSEGEQKVKFPCKLTYPKHLSLFEFCEETLKKDLLEGIAKRDSVFQDFINGAAYAAFIKEFDQKNPTCTQLQRKYAFYEHQLNNEDYKSFIGKNDKTKKTGDLNLVALVTHKGAKIDDECYFRGIANRKDKDWFSFKEGDVDVVKLDDALKYVGSSTTVEDETAHVLLYKVVHF